jgi:predicted protein tyrosine phosphatase
MHKAFARSLDQSLNRLRSPTAEQVFSRRQNLEVDSAGTNHDADDPLTAELVAWADVILVTERRTAASCSVASEKLPGGRRVICLDTPDDYDFMQPELITLVEVKVSRHLPAMPVRQSHRLNRPARHRE